MKLNIDPKLRASVEEAVAELTANLKEKQERDREIAQGVLAATQTDAEIPRISNAYRIGTGNTAQKLAALREERELVGRRIHQLNQQNSEAIRPTRELNTQVEPVIEKLGFFVRDAVMADVQAKLAPIFGKDEAARLAEYSTPVRILNEMVRERFHDGSNESFAVFDVSQRMVAFASAVLKDDWDPFKWRKNADVMRFLVAPPAEAKGETTAPASLVEISSQ